MENDDRDMRRILVAVLVAIGIGGAVDLVLDAPDRVSAHVIYELCLVGFSLGTAVMLWVKWHRAERTNVQLRRTLAERQAERDAWAESARNALDGLGRAIDSRFEAWGLTPAERDVALMLLKGRSHKEIAAATDRSERTVRQHAATVYGKAELGGRAELAAFFLENLMLPRDRPRE
ncbi:MAG TPA: LuxR C-terminal-related transcriptional regulator [Gemmatimonadales bacterium]|nr:LuxR C-terminal-related transcriptional regulator [Gemmatimonadales bacterium]